MSENKPWVDQLGNVVTIQDIINALNLGRSLISKEVHFNANIKKLNQVPAYRRNAYILDLIRDAYLEAAGAKKEKPRLIIPGGK